MLFPTYSTFPTILMKLAMSDCEDVILKIKIRVATTLSEYPSFCMCSARKPDITKSCIMPEKVLIDQHWPLEAIINKWLPHPVN